MNAQNIDASPSTPLLDQYYALKKEAADALLLFRVGDFYEAYGEDARALSQALEIVLTGRDARGVRVPMSGVPHHTLENHLKTLLALGHKVAISEQLEEASQAKGLIRRDIVRFLTPGTLLEPSLLNEKEPNHLLAVFPGEKRYGLSWCDVSTGAWLTTLVPSGKEFLEYHLSKILPREVVIPEGAEEPAHLSRQGYPITRATGKDEASLPESLPMEARQACQLLYGYLKKIYRGEPPHLSPPVVQAGEKHLVLDPVSSRNLELFRNLASGGREGSLLHILDRTRTAMGARLLRHWLLHPLVNLDEIRQRQNAVADLLAHPQILDEVQHALSRLADLERLSSRVSFGTAHARDLLAVKGILKEIPGLVLLALKLSAEFFQACGKNMPDFSSLHNFLDRSLHPDPPLGLKEGGLVREGYEQRLDELKQELRDSRGWIAALEERERKATGIKSLKVGFNQVFGYYIEVTRAHLSSVPTRYIRKQTLANAERFVIEDLKLQEAKILSGQEKIKNLEYEIFGQIREEVKKRSNQLRLASLYLSELDVLASLAAVARDRNYSRPRVHEGDLLRIRIEAGRHPVVEASLSTPFVPNDCLLDTNESRLLLITGPNMAGKSTYLRQIALMVILAQMGSFVPAQSAEIGLADRIFTRIGASDDLHRGESTFFVEMKETAEILKSATPKSLVLLDEIGRGTSTFDGLSLAWATAEELVRQKTRVLFATHYHEMTALAGHFHGVRNFTVAVKDRGDEVIFLRRIVPGATDKSYGIHVARLAGIPHPVVERARQILAQLEAKDVGKRIGRGSGVQLPLLPESVKFADPAEPEENASPLLASLKEIDVHRLTGLEALNLLATWKEKYCSE